MKRGGLLDLVVLVARMMRHFQEGEVGELLPFVVVVEGEEEEEDCHLVVGEAEAVVEHCHLVVGEAEAEAVVVEHCHLVGEEVEGLLPLVVVKQCWRAEQEAEGDQHSDGVDVQVVVVGD